MFNDYKVYLVDSLVYMKMFVIEYGFLFLYLIDEDQVVVCVYDVVCMLDFFGFNVKGELQYCGCFDDVCMGDVFNCILDFLNVMWLIVEIGQGFVEQIFFMGCLIKWV